MNINHSSDIGYQNNAFWINNNYTFKSQQTVLIVIELTVIAPQLSIVRERERERERERAERRSDLFTLLCTLRRYPLFHSPSPYFSRHY